MYILIAIFYASILCMLGMILLKHREVKTGHPTLISRIFQGTDNFFHAVFFSIRRTVSYVNKHTFIALAQLIAYHVLSHVRTWYLRVRERAHENPHTRKVIDMVRGRHEVKDHGASFYLKRISNE